jgi:hypothetical protein
MSTPFRNNECRSLPQDSGPSRINNGANLTGSPSQEGPGDEKDEEIARLKPRAYHDAVMDTTNRKPSAKTNT